MAESTDWASAMSSWNSFRKVPACKMLFFSYFFYLSYLSSIYTPLFLNLHPSKWKLNVSNVYAETCYTYRCTKNYRTQWDAYIQTTHCVFQSHNVVLLVRVNDAVGANRHSVCLAVVREPGEVNGASGGRHGCLVGRNCPVSSQRVGCCVYLCVQQTITSSPGKRTIRIF